MYTFTDQEMLGVVIIGLLALALIYRATRTPQDKLRTDWFERRMDSNRWGDRD